MNDPNPNQRGTRNIRQLNIFCLCATAAVGLGAILNQVVPGSPFGGPDAPFMIGYFTLLGFLYIVLPAHVIGLGISLYYYVQSSDCGPYRLSLSYYVIWFCGVFSIAIMSAAADPVFKKISDYSFRQSHQAEVSLVAALQRGGGRASIEQLVMNGANVDMPDRNFGMTPLHWASIKSDARTLELLLNAGADANVKYQRTWGSSHYSLEQASALDLSAWSENEPLQKVTLLLDAGAIATDPAIVAPCWSNNGELFQRLLRAGADPVTGRDGKHMTCLHAAAQNGHETLVRELLSLGADANAALKFKPRPLDLALENEHREIAVLLMLAGGTGHHSERMVDFLLQIPESEFDAIARLQPLAKLDESSAWRRKRNALANCDVAMLERLVRAGLTREFGNGATQLVPDQCDARDQLLDLIQ